ncbi:MAG TPA: MFS transporter [Holophagaceae bacterium]|nr:MFS transporter [Holophagaceae bacterium]
MNSESPEPGAGSPERHDPYSALRFSEFRWFMVSSFLLSLAMQMQSTILGWQVYAITGTAWSLGIVGLSEAAPFLALTLVGGHVADRHDRRAISLGFVALLLAGGAVLFGLNLHGLPSAAWPFYAVQGAAGLARAFYRPASSALGTELVPREAYANAAAWRTTQFQVAMVAGPALGGLVYGFISPRAAYGLELALLAAGALFLAFVKPRPREAAADAPRPAFFDGVRFVWREKSILGAMTLDLFAVLFGGAPALLPIFAGPAFLNVGAQGLGLLRAAPAIGSVITSLALAHMPPLRRAGKVLLWNVGLFGLCWIVFAISKSFWLSFFMLGLSGATDDVSVVVRSTLVQTLTPPAMMGRVQAVNGFFIGSSNEVGAFESGFAASWLGVVPSVVIGGCLTVAVVLFTAWRVPALRNLREIHK